MHKKTRIELLSDRTVKGEKSEQKTNAQTEELNFVRKKSQTKTLVVVKIASTAVHSNQSSHLPQEVIPGWEETFEASRFSACGNIFGKLLKTRLKVRFRCIYLAALGSSAQFPQNGRSGRCECIPENIFVQLIRFLKPHKRSYVRHLG